MDWISVKDRLPELKDRSPNKNLSSDPVLVFSGSISVGVRWKCGDREYFLSNEEWERNEITHWMTLPEPPKDEHEMA